MFTTGDTDYLNLTWYTKQARASTFQSPHRHPCKTEKKKEKIEEEKNEKKREKKIDRQSSSFADVSQLTRLVQNGPIGYPS